MTHQRPTSVVFLAILGIVLSLFGFCGNGLGLAEPALNVLADNLFNDDEPPPDEGNATESPVMTIVSAVLSFVGVVLSVLLLVAAVGLLRLRPWGRRLCLLVAVLLVLLCLAGVGVVAYEAPRILDEMRATDDPAEAFFGEFFAYQGIAVGVVIDLVGLLYAILAFAILLRPSVRVAFAAPPS